MMKPLVTLLSALCLAGFARGAFASTAAEEFLAKAGPSAKVLEDRFSASCENLLAEGEVRAEAVLNDISYGSTKFTYFPHPTGPVLYRRYNHQADTKQDHYMFLVEKPFQSEAIALITNAIRELYPDIRIETKAYDTTWNTIVISENANKRFPGVKIKLFASPAILDEVAGLFKSGFPLADVAKAAKVNLAQKFRAAPRDFHNQIPGIFGEDGRNILAQPLSEKFAGVPLDIKMSANGRFLFVLGERDVFILSRGNLNEGFSPFTTVVKFTQQFREPVTPTSIIPSEDGQSFGYTYLQMQNGQLVERTTQFGFRPL